MSLRVFQGPLGEVQEVIECLEGCLKDLQGNIHSRPAVEEKRLEIYIWRHDYWLDLERVPEEVARRGSSRILPEGSWRILPEGSSMRLQAH